MASSLADSALDVLAEVAAYLATGIDSDEAKASVAGALKRGLKLAHCRLWVRGADGSSFRPICAPDPRGFVPGCWTTFGLVSGPVTLPR